VYLEVLDDKGEPCAPGQSGRVIVTPLHNFACPLIRYELGDYAEVGPACGCGRGLPVIRRILGRSRNLMRLRDGRAFWPLFGTTEFPDLAPIRQFQLVQQSYDELEVRLSVLREPTEGELKRLGEHIVRNAGYPFRIRWTFLPEISYNNGGKFEEFICMVRE
jgi:phenylacetate-CoA ligase